MTLTKVKGCRESRTLTKSTGRWTHKILLRFHMLFGYLLPKVETNKKSIAYKLDVIISIIICPTLILMNSVSSLLIYCWKAFKNLVGRSEDSNFVSNVVLLQQCFLPFST